MAVASRWAATALLAISLSACGAAYDSDRFWNDATFWEEGKASEEAMAALSKGDFVRAEALGTDAMRRNPKDPYALLALAVVYQNTGRPALARQYYEVLASMNPQATAMIGVGPTAERRTIAEIAAQNLVLLKGGGQGASQGYADPPEQSALLAVPPPPVARAGDLGTPDDANIILRFQTLRRLLDESLITREEYNQRRGANLGALLRYTAPAPAPDLGRPAPNPVQVVDRLKTLARAFAQKSISAGELATERTAILEALLPAHPMNRADPPPPLTDEMQAAAVTGRMEKLRAANVITADEQTREKDAAFHAVQMHLIYAEAAARAAAGLTPPVTTPTGAGVRLAAYRSDSQARAAWAWLRKKYPRELGSLQPVINKVSVRRRGTFYRLSAGPLASQQAAVNLCRTLRRYRQACAPTVLGR